jgi:hypothetical protein
MFVGQILSGSAVDAFPDRLVNFVTQINPLHCRVPIMPKAPTNEHMGPISSLSTPCAHPLPGLVKVVLGHFEPCRQMASSCAQRVALAAQLVLCGSWQFEQVRPAACMLLCRNQKRAILVDLAVELPVRVIEAGLQQRREIGVGETSRRADGRL